MGSRDKFPIPVSRVSMTVWTLMIVTMVAIRSHNCLLTLIVGEGNGAVKVANNGTIVQKWPVAIAKLIS